MEIINDTSTFPLDPYRLKRYVYTYEKGAEHSHPVITFGDKVGISNYPLRIRMGGQDAATAQKAT